MGTRGYYVFLYHGVYYVFYNQFDSYFAGLGMRITKELSSFTEDQFAQLKHLVSQIPLGEHPGLIHYKDLFTAATTPLEFEYRTALTAPVCDIFIEFIYIIDLDSNKFTVKTHHGDYVSYLTIVDWMKSMT